MLTMLFLAFTSSIIYAEDVKQKTTEELIAEFMQTSKKREEAKKKLEEEKTKTLAIEKELESAKKVGKKLNELKIVLSK